MIIMAIAIVTTFSNALDSANDKSIVSAGHFLNFFFESLYTLDVFLKNI